MTDSKYIQVSVSVNTKRDAIEYKGFEIEYSIDSNTCECCGTTNDDVTWDAYNYTTKKSFYDCKNLAEVFQKIDSIEENENEGE